MSKTIKAKKVSAIDAIIQPFSYLSKSEQTHSEPKKVLLGGKTQTVSILNKRTGEYESITRVTGGQEISASHRIRSGKTARERNAKVREKPNEPVAKSKPKKK